MLLLVYRRLTIWSSRCHFWTSRLRSFEVPPTLYDLSKSLDPRMIFRGTSHPVWFFDATPTMYDRWSFDAPPTMYDISTPLPPCMIFRCPSHHVWFFDAPPTMYDHWYFDYWYFYILKISFKFIIFGSADAIVSFLVPIVTKYNFVQ